MIPLPSLLVLDSPPRLLGEKGASDRDTRKGKNTTNHHIGRRNAEKRQRGERIALTPPAPLRLRRIQKIDPPRYQDVGHQVAPFWERQQLEEEEERSPRKQTVASVRRHSQLFAFCVTLVNFVAVDTYTLLPTGTILYMVALSMAWENWELEEQENLRYLEKIRQYRKQMERIEDEVQKAQFEYHVLRNQPHVNIMALRKTKHNPDKSDNGLDFDPDNNTWIVYADGGRRRPPPPPPVWRSNSDRRK